MALKLFCLPYAGGSGMIYNQWKKSFHGLIQLCPIELAGRGVRFSEPFYASIAQAVDDVYELIKNELEQTPYAFFGHSMGSLLIYELVRKIENSGFAGPVHLFLSGRYPPHIIKRDIIYHLLPDAELKSEILKMGGTPKEVFENPELLAVYMAILRADYKILETYQFIPGNQVLNSPLTVFRGKEDESVTGDDLLKWRQYTKNECEIHEYEGGHFFIFDRMEDVIEIINDTLVQAIIQTGIGQIFEI
ncbi:MAG TPA: thioesterase domain-containing protein [Bacillota bacterium]|nr:thioesterase domain-containing protein [Bacillota bacterium]